MKVAKPSGRRLSKRDADQVLGMVARGDRKHDIAAWFGVNQGRIAEVKQGVLHPGAKAAPQEELPHPGPYTSGRGGHAAMAALVDAKVALQLASNEIDKTIEAVQAGKM